MFDNKGYFEKTKTLIIDNHFNPKNTTLDFFKSDNLHNIIERANVTIFNFQENIPREILFIIEDLAKLNIKFYILTFSLTLKNYFDKKYPNHQVEFPNLYTANNYHYTTTNFELILNPVGGRKYDLMYFHASRKPFRDKTTKFLIDNNLINDNNIISIRYNTDLDDNGTMLFYKEYHEENTFLDIHYDTFRDYINIHPSQEDVLPWGDQRYQDYKLYQSHLNSKFNIITEACYPFSQSEHEILRNISSVSKRTIFPILFKNIFHIYPENKPLKNWLLENKFKLFFENDEDFLNNLNSEFYNRTDIQEKLEYNAKLMRKFFIQSAYDTINSLEN